MSKRIIPCTLVVTRFQAIALTPTMRGYFPGDTETVGLTDKVEFGYKAWRNMATSRCKRALGSIQKRHPDVLIQQRGGISWEHNTR